MKRVMRKIFVSVLALAMIVGIIGVQKMSVSAADVNYYSHIDVKADVVLYDADDADEANGKQYKFESVDSVKIFYTDNLDEKPLTLDFYGTREEKGIKEYGFVVDKYNVIYKNDYYKINDGRDGKDFEHNTDNYRFGDNFKRIVVTATIKAEGEATGVEYTFEVNHDTAMDKNTCSGKDQDKYRGIDIQLSKHLEKAEELVKYKYTFLNGGVEVKTGYVEEGKCIPKEEIPTEADFSIAGGMKFDGWKLEGDEFGRVFDTDGVNEIALLSDIVFSASLSNDEPEVTPKPPVEEEKKEEKPIIPDYTPVVPSFVEEKEEEVIEIIEEEVPEAPAEEPVEEEEEVVEEIEVEIPEIPEALPKTGTASVELFFGLGSFFMTIGAAFVLFARRKN